MLTPFPETGRIDVSPVLAGEFLQSVQRLPLFDNQQFYSPALQQLVLNHVRALCAAGFDDLVNQIRDRIANWPYCVLVRGLSFDEGNRLFVAINRAFGDLVARPYEKPRAQLVHYIQPATDLPSARGGHESERLHTDTADWETPVELISMVCVRADREGGGRSRVLDVTAIRDEVGSRLGQATLDLLQSEPVPWLLAPYCGGGVKWRTVLTDNSVCWRRYTIDLALEANDTQLSDEILSALEAFENVVGGTERTVEFLMREGEFLISDNTRTIHARTPISAGIASDRLMIRSWIRTSGTEG